MAKYMELKTLKTMSSDNVVKRMLADGISSNCYFATGVERNMSKAEADNLPLNTIEIAEDTAGRFYVEKVNARQQGHTYWILTSAFVRKFT